MKRFAVPLILVLTLGWYGCQEDSSPTAMAPDDTNDQPALKSGDIVPGRFIVVLDHSAKSGRSAMTAASVAADHGVLPDMTYTGVIHGFSGEATLEEVAELRADPRVEAVYPDRYFILAPPPGKGPNKDPDNGGGDGGTTQTTPDNITAVGGMTVAGHEAGKIWIIDTGIDLDHPDLNVDVANAANFVTRGKNSADDGNGHGTHCAGIAAAIDNSRDVVGVAAGATVVPIRCLDNNGSGYYSWIIAAVDHVSQNAKPGDVANMSLGGPKYAPLDQSVVNLSTVIPVAVAAGNDTESCTAYSPAHLGTANTGVYTVSSYDLTSGCLSYFSNWDAEYSAPGRNILSLWKSGGTNTISGTSMATPHVAGLLALGRLSSNGTICSDPDGSADPKAYLAAQ